VMTSRRSSSDSSSALAVHVLQL